MKTKLSGEVKPNKSKEITRDEHIAWCKSRAIGIVNDGGRLQDAISSLVNDLGKHDETINHGARTVASMQFVSGKLGTATKMINFINGIS